MGVWQQTAPLPAGRRWPAACWNGGKVYVFGGGGGTDGGTLTQTTFIYDPAGNTWSLGAVVPQAVSGAFAFPMPDGTISVLTADGRHWAYDPATNTWANRPGNTISRSSVLAFQDASDRIYLAMGSGRKVERYDPATSTWTTLPDAPFSAFGTGAVGVLGDDGRCYTGQGAFNTGLITYDPATGTWGTTPPMPDTNNATNVNVARLPNGLILALAHGNFDDSRSYRLTRIDGYDPATSTWAMGAISDFSGYVTQDGAVAVDPSGLIYVMGGVTVPVNSYTPIAASFVYLQNRPPSVATLLTMTGGALVSTAVTNRARHLFNDQDPGDSQSKADHRWKKTSDTTWITETVISPNPWRDFPAGSLTPGNWERQVLPYDAAGAPAPAWTPSGLFTAADPPAGPTITYPINGQILDQVEYVEWSIPSQEAYRVRRVADDGAGAPDTGTVYYDTGAVTDTLTRKVPLTFETNSRTEHIQVQIKDGGLWSPWASVSGAVSFTPPPAPSFTVYPDPSTGSLLVMIATPDPAPGDPPAVSTRIYVTEPLPSGVVVEERRAKDLPTNTSWRYWDPVGSWEYAAGRIRVESVAANGATASSS